ncbi:Response regulator receiver domain-containing protein [Lachnospiraceae bacterium C10]|nr:Response regulator receiver domain-containing protein [Lachnospiraceae bacterium C10]SDW36797.1 Response regulator receiver domain-containing protein [Lachnospiraceae bacterium KHCPX20]
MRSRNQILLIGDPRSFMVLAMKNELEQRFRVVSCEANCKAVRMLGADVPTTILYYVDGPADPDLTEYLRDVILNDGRDFYINIVGDQDSIDSVYETIPQEQISAAFLRPINVREMVDQLSAAASKKANSAIKKKILVVDDDPVMLRAIKGWLMEYYRVYVVNSAMNVITFLAKNSVDLILLDYEMPIVDGPQLLKMIRSEESTKDIPVMFLTSKSDKEHVLTAANLKPEAYLLKTMPKKDILNNITEFFKRTS